MWAALAYQQIPSPSPERPILCQSPTPADLVRVEDRVLLRELITMLKQSVFHYVQLTFR